MADALGTALDVPSEAARMFRHIRANVAGQSRPTLIPNGHADNWNSEQSSRRVLEQSSRRVLEQSSRRVLEQSSRRASPRRVGCLWSVRRGTVGNRSGLGWLRNDRYIPIRIIPLRIFQEPNGAELVEGRQRLFGG